MDDKFTYATPIDAIYILKFIRDGYDKNFADGGKYKYLQSLDIGVEAIVKQLLTKPVSNEIHYVNSVFTGDCPSCNERVYSQCKFCPECGQKLGWTKI